MGFEFDFASDAQSFASQRDIHTAASILPIRSPHGIPI